MLLIAANPLCGFTTSVVFCLGHALLKQCITNNIPNIISKNIGYENIKHSVVAKSNNIIYVSLNILKVVSAITLTHFINSIIHASCVASNKFGFLS